MNDGPPSASPVLVEVREQVLLVTLNRPNKMNTINSEVSRGLQHAIRLLDEDAALRVGVLTGADNKFSAGMDLQAFASEGPPDGFQSLIESGSKKVLIAAIERFALAGGLELALMCDLIVASQDTRLGIPEAKVGLIAAGGGLIHLPRRLPRGVALEMAVTGEPITAEVARSFGLVNRVCGHGEALETAMALAKKIAANAPLSVDSSKAVIRATASHPDADAWLEQRRYTKQVFTSSDAKEGAAAFVQKREPVWTGR